VQILEEMLGINKQIRQTFTQKIDIKAVIEPVNFMRIDVNITRNFNKEYNETFKFNQDINEFEHLSPYTAGSFSSSFIGLGSFFRNRTANYNAFLDNRIEVSRRLGNSNPYVNGTRDPNSPAFSKGYTQYSQDVLIPAFLAAYGGRKVENIPLMNENNNGVKANPFKNYLPLPNWRVTYNGLSKIRAFQGKVKTINITHGYNGTMNMNSFTSNLTFFDMLGVGFPSFIDSNTNNFVPFFQVPNITIQESFGPLAGIDIAMENGLSLKLSYNRSRMTSLSLVDYQISETRSQDIVFGMGHRLKGVKLPFTFFGISELKNDLTIRMDMAYRDDITTNTYFAGNREQPTRGQWVLTIAPRLEYMVNENLQIVGYYERRQTFPYIMNSYPTINTRFGIKLIYLFTQ
jgi:cell surface protein SprA